MEKLVIDQLEGVVKVPADVGFECPDKSLLMDQLKVLQMVLRKERNNSGSGPSDSKAAAACTASNSDSGASGSLKDKADRHKQMAAQRREGKLKDLDEKAGALFKSSSSNGKSSTDSNKIYTMREELGNLKVAIERTLEDDSSQGKKRNSNSADADQSEKKKSKTSDEDVQECSQSSESSGSSKGKSIIQVYQSCTSARSRDEVRERAIKMMRQQGLEVSVVEPGNFALKYALSEPYHLFFTRVQKSKDTYDQQLSITFPEILDRSLGEIVNSLQINFMVDVGWLCLQYMLAGQRTDMLILYGERVDTEKVGLNITMIPVDMASKFGCHHTKIMVLKYKDDGIRVIVSTANLYSDDWNNRTQGCVT